MAKAKRSLAEGLTRGIADEQRKVDERFSDAERHLRIADAETLQSEPKAPVSAVKRTGYTVTDDDLKRLARLEKRTAKLGLPKKKSELVRAGWLCLERLSDEALLEIVEKVEVIQVGRKQG